MLRKSTLYVLTAVLFVAAMVLSACGAAPTEAPVAPEATEAPAAPVAELSVGVVLPTKDEPRWIQDETRFNEAFDAAGYDVEILFSQGDSAIELSNVEQLITQGIEVLILTPHDGAAAAAATPAPGVPLCSPSSCRVASMAASAVSTSRSQTKPRWPMRKTLPATFERPAPSERS